MAAERTVGQVTGTVAIANDRGLKLVGESEWRNISRFAASVVVPPMGTRVVLDLDRSGYVRGLAPADAAVADTVPGNLAPTGANSDAPDRETRITRSACLNTAVSILQAGGRTPEVAAVLACAAALESWVTR